MPEEILSFETFYDALQPDEVVLREARGREAMSTLYEYVLTLEVNRDGGLAAADVDGLLSKPCFVVATGGRSVEVHGILRELELVAANEASPVVYRAVLVPRLWNTTRTFRSRVYQEVNVKQLIDQVLSLSALEAEWNLADEGVYPVMEYAVQYEESDFDFISRQLEHWGIYYYFRQSPDGETLVIADHDAQFEPLEAHETLTFNPRLGRSGVGDSVHALSARWRPLSASVTVRDYNYRTPTIDLMEEHPVDERSGFGLQWRYGDHFKTVEEGQRIAQIRAEQILCSREVYDGRCSAPGLAPGHAFELVGCPLPDLNITFLVTSVEPHLSVASDGSDDAYQYRFTAVPLQRDDPPPVPYRSQITTPWPSIEGFMHGIVDGEAPGTAAPIDSEGRYKVILPLDSVAQPGGRASRWIRMAQPSAGQNYGVHFPLHIGTEVAIIHLDGDPDRPVILGSIPNAETTSPVVQDNATQSRIRTRTGILVEFDDDAM